MKNVIGFIIGLAISLVILPISGLKTGNVEVVTGGLPQEIVADPLLSDVSLGDSSPVSKFEREGIWRTITAYTSTAEQTDDDPCIGASGNICWEWQVLGGRDFLCASNEFPLGTILFIGGELQSTCKVIDRTGNKDSNIIDLYFGFDKDCLDNYQPGDICPNLIKAKEFGTMKANVWVY